MRRLSDSGSPAAGLLRFLNNLPIAAKSLIAPSVSAGVMLGIVALVLVTYRTIEHAEALGVGLAHAVEQAMDFTGKLGRGHSSLYRATSLRSQDVETRIVEARIEEARTDWDNAGTILAALQQWVRSDAAREALGPAGAERETALLGDTSGVLRAYSEIAREAADFVAVDAFVATMYVNGAQAKYADAQAKVATIIADLNR